MSDKEWLLVICLVGAILFFLYDCDQELKEIKDFIYSIFTDDSDE